MATIGSELGCDADVSNSGGQVVDEFNHRPPVLGNSAYFKHHARAYHAGLWLTPAYLIPPQGYNREAASSIAAITAAGAVWCTMCPAPGTECRVLLGNSQCSLPDCSSKLINLSSSPAIIATGHLKLGVVWAGNEGAGDH